MSLTSRLLLCCVLVWTAVVGASEAEPRIRNILVQVDAGRLLIDADVDLSLSREVRQAAERGLPIYLTADLVITHSRWWWFDRTDIETSRTWRIGYNALTRQWRIGTGALNFSVASLDEALKVVSSIRRWDIGAIDEVAEGTALEGQIRMRLDNSLLPRPMQVNALNSSAWSVATPWTDFDFEIAEGGSLHR
ncbi:MAG: DUF4390 domain-containing protein [Burkholderiaceae bacterium]|nr:DUF4390 domain-containing protein [Burkholderiaceae bacterium]